MSTRQYILIIALLLSFGNYLRAQTVFRGKILDAATQQPIENAKIGISDQGIGVVTNERGLFNYRKYHQTIGNNSELIISALGYDNLALEGDDIRALYNKSSKILLVKNETDEIVREFSDQKMIDIFWDSSLSAASRNTGKEWDFLKAYFNELETVTVNFIAFNEKLQLNKQVKITKDISPLRELAQSIKYEGATSYEILPYSKADAVLLFSDGNPVLGSWQGDRSIPNYLITSANRSNTKYLIAHAKYTSGSYVDLYNHSVEDCLNQVIKGITTLDVSAVKKQMLTGVVSTSSGPIQGASITIKGDLEEFLSKADGSFSVPAKEGDILQLRYLGMYPKEMLVESLNVLQVELKPLDELLDEVVLKGKKKKSAQTSDAGFGEKSVDQIGVSVNTISSKDIRPNAQNLSDVIRGRFAGVTVNGFGEEAVFTIRGGNSSKPAIWVVDGSIFPEVPRFVDPQNVYTISILKSIQASSRYGSIASGGAFIVKTKAMAGRDKKGEIVDLALVKGNDYEEQVAQINFDALTPDYVQQLKGIDGKEAQFERYENLVKANTTNATFFIDMALYFQTVYPEKAKTIRTRLAEVAQGNPKVLRVLGYLYENAQEYESALKIYERVVQLSPGEAQSYRDLAQAYEQVGIYDKALELYINMLSEQILGVDFSHIERALGHELLHLSSLHRDKIDYTKLPEEWLINDYKLDLRMVIEWSDTEAPFEFQFVNPLGKYFKWNHTLFDNKERLEAEVKAGFQFEEFVIDEAPHGLWIVNIEYLGEDQYVTIPPYLKYTIYRDYGSKSERKETIIIKLSKEIGKAQLHEFLL
jgi:tetratricopeptide (TPR) repeat protein